MADPAVETTVTVAQLAAEVARLQAALDTMTAERDRYRHLYEQLREAYAKLEHGLRGQQAERLPPDDRQLTLGLLGPRSTPQNRPCVDGSKPANEVEASRQGRHYRVVSSESKLPRLMDEKPACGCP